MFETFNRLPDFYQGIIYIAVGVAMTLYALGLFGKGITIVIVLFSIYLVIVGCVKVGLYRKIVKALPEIDKKK